MLLSEKNIYSRCLYFLLCLQKKMEEKKNWWNWLAIASFVLALVWGFLCIIIIWLPLWIICLILALLFGIIALCKKQTKWASIIWILFSILWIAAITICTTIVWKFVIQHKDEIISPITEFSTRINENPEIAALMEDENFSDKFNEILKEKLDEKYGNNYSDIKDLDWIFDIWADTFKEMQNVASELAEQQWISASEEPVAGIANPASEFCVAQGGELIPMEDEEWNQYAMCRFADGSEIEEWEYFRANADTTSDTVESHVCGEFYKSGEEIVCTEQYAPVCGNDGKTYGNSCFACIEVDSYTDWECSAD